jgi:hypothetical protein
LLRASRNDRGWPEAEWLLSGEQSGEADISFPAGLDPKRTADQWRLRAKSAHWLGTAKRTFSARFATCS